MIVADPEDFRCLHGVHPFDTCGACEAARIEDLDALDDILAVANHDCDENLVRTSQPNIFECAVCLALCNLQGEYN